jgi:drug/metabolite transporter (DMT)-like permease
MLPPILKSLPPALRGALWMVATVALSALTILCIRMATQEVHPFVAAFFRNFVGLLLILPWTARGAWKPPRAFPLYAVRAACSVASMLTFFTALTLVPMAEATALYLTMPLFAVLSAALVLGERVGWARGAAVLAGFAGALLILRPGLEGLSVGALAALAGAFFGAGDWLALKPLARTDSTRAVVAWFTLLTTPVSLVPALFVWQTPSVEALAWLAGLAAAATLGQATATRAAAASDLSYLALFDFLRVVFVAAIGFAVFGEVLEPWTVAGAAVIVLASAQAAGHEMRARRNAGTGCVG